MFVDDEPNVLDGIRRMLRGKREEWDMEFVSSGEEASLRMCAIRAIPVAEARARIAHNSVPTQDVTYRERAS